MQEAFSSKEENHASVTWRNKRSRARILHFVNISYIKNVHVYVYVIMRIARVEARVFSVHLPQTSI
jgi:hypothetical protein